MTDPVLVALLKANMRAGEIRDAEVNRHEPWRAHGSLPIMRGAPTHSCAYLLQALVEDGWELRKVGEP